MGVIAIRRPIRLKIYIGALSAVAAVLLVDALLDIGEGVNRPGVMVSAAVLIFLGERVPLYVGQYEEGEGLSLGETFFVAMIFLLPPNEAILAYVVGVAAGEMARRPEPLKAAFNVSQFTIAAAAGVAVAHLLGSFAVLQPLDVVAVVLGACTFFLVNSVLVAAVLALAQQRSFVEALLAPTGIRMFVWAGNVSLGLLVGIVGVAYVWALPFALVPVLVLHLAFASHLRERSAHARVRGLFRTAMNVNRPMDLAHVTEALLAAAQELLRCGQARLDTEPPGSDELGARVTRTEADRWLVVSDRRGAEPFDDNDQSLLEAIAAVGATALENAGLYERVAVERRKLADVVEGSSDGIFSLGDDGTIQSWNPAMARIAGVPSEEAAGRRLPAVVPLYDTDGNSWLPSPALVDEPSLVEVRLPGDEHRWLSCSCSPLPEGGVVVVARDITAQREVDELKADFLATVSHELRTPLTPIKGFLATLRDREDRLDNEQRKHVYEVMAMQANRLERLVSDLLDATVLDRHEVLFLTEEVDWQATVDRVIDLFGVQAPDREIVAEVSPALPAVLADEQRAEQVLSNLLANAIKYSPPGASVRVVVEERDGDVVTTLIDQGPGVAPAQRARIFDRFVRLGEYQTRSSGGAGLGLYIARQLVEAMGGTIYVEEGPEGGSAFSFTLPTAARDRSPR